MTKTGPRHLGAAVALTALMAVPACSAGPSAESPAADVVASAAMPASGLAGMPAGSLTGPLTTRADAAPAATRPAPRSAGGAVTITAVGDTMLGSVPDLPPDPAAYLDPVEPVLRHGRQLVFANLEGTLTTATSGKCGRGSKPHPDCFAFRDPPS